MIVTGMFRNKRRTGYGIILGNTLEISEYVEFYLYDYYLYLYSPQGFPQEKKHLVRWIGVTHRFVQAMVYDIMSNNRNDISHSNVFPIEP